MLSQFLRILCKTKVKKEEVRTTIPSSDSIESEILGEEEEAHTVKLYKKKKVVVTGDSLLKGISEKGLTRNHQLTVKNFRGNGKLSCR